MTSHNVIEVLDCSVRCSCGRVITAASLEQAQADHLFHFQVQSAREALPQEEEDGA